LAVRSSIAAQASSEFAVSRRRPAIVLEDGIRRWLPQSIAEWVWWPVLAICTFLPTSVTPVLKIGDLLLTVNDFLLACLPLFMLPYAISCRKRDTRIFRWTFLPFTLLAVYASKLHLAILLIPCRRTSLLTRR
jgi:hypothetical protein